MRMPGVDWNIRVPFEEKVRLTEKVKKLKPDDLTNFVHMVQELCPGAVTDLDTKRLQIKVDDIDKSAFTKVSSMLDAKISVDDDLHEPPNKKAKTK